ncbi:hypothetical protein F4805DRAFT_477862 [Annulohypoxylon moriforme]|nr:hypothetical protein F4805DRAFT_477862 [Annulohypoxylon moriforme]
MAVTEIALMASSAPGEIPEALRNLGVAGIALQGEWCAKDAPWLIPDRGAALFQQVEDPGMLLITAHWDSVDQHHAVLVTPENQELLVDLPPLVNAAIIRPGHVDGGHMFPKSEDEGFAPALTAPALVGVLDEFVKPYRHRGGWKIEKADGEDIEQYFIAGGLDNVKKSAAFAHAEGYDQSLSPLALNVETKHYKRIG